MSRQRCGVVLAGGFSRRMGRDKALVSYHGVPQGQRAYDLLSGYCDRVVVSCRPGQFAGTELEGIPEIHDEVADQGPLGGLLTAMHQSPEVDWLLLACDLPRVDETILEFLIEQQDPTALVTSYRDPDSGLPEPMCAIFTPASLPVVEAKLEQGQRCARKVLIQMEEALQLLDLPRPDAMCNVNAPEDWLQGTAKGA